MTEFSIIYNTLNKFNSCQDFKKNPIKKKYKKYRIGKNLIYFYPYSNMSGFINFIKNEFEISNQNSGLGFKDENLLNSLLNELNLKNLTFIEKNSFREIILFKNGNNLKLKFKELFLPNLRLKKNDIIIILSETRI